MATNGNGNGGFGGIVRDVRGIVRDVVGDVHIPTAAGAVLAKVALKASPLAAIGSALFWGGAVGGLKKALERRRQSEAEEQDERE